MVLTCCMTCLQYPRLYEEYRNQKLKIRKASAAVDSNLKAVHFKVRENCQF